MSAEEILRASERSALKNNQVLNGAAIKRRSLGAVGLITLIMIVLVALVSFGNLVPSAILERLIEATDVQYADAVESKILVFQQALAEGSVPENTVKRLEANGIKIEGSSLVYNGETITASNFVNKIHSDASFYNAFNAATYDRAAYYYDAAAEEVFKKIGTSRNNYTASSSFDAVMSGLVGEGSSINVSNANAVEKTDEKGNKYTDYEATERASSNSGSAEEFVNLVAESNTAEDALTATMNATDALNTADTISKEQKSSIFFMALMENISKMKAGQGNTAKINEAMNFLYEEQESSVVDVKTGEKITAKGSMLEAPSLYAILAGERVDGNQVINYASDRVLKTVENKVGVGAASTEIKDGNITSANTKIRGTIGRLLPEVGESASIETLSAVTPTINSSLIENSFETIGGIYGGELLVEGAVNVGKELAKASGGTAGDSEAVQRYAKLNDTILALDAEADRINRSPFDISSKNTFLGSIFYNLGVSMRRNGFIKTFASAVNSLLPTTLADDGADDYLNTFGECETINSIGAVGTVGCAERATFDTSTLNDTFHDEGFISFVEENTTLDESGQRVINKDSKLANFIKYNNERITPIGIVDGGILESINSGSSKLSFISNIIAMIKAWLGASDEDKNMATGKSFVNSSSNPDWETYKYAQRYVSLSRATDALRQYDGDETAYNNLKFFEGTENPVIAFLKDYYSESLANF